MAGIRRMTSKRGGVGGPVAQPGSPGNQADVQPRTLPSGLTLARPYRVGQSPAAASTTSTWFNPQSLMFWRYVFLGLALAYVMGYHVSIGKLRVRL